MHKVGSAAARSFPPENGRDMDQAGGIWERFFADHDAMTEALVAEVAERLRLAVGEGRRASFVASGGVTPIALYDKLCRSDLDWAEVDVCPTDERWVAPTLDGSNEKLIRTRLLREAAAAAAFIPFKTDDAEPEAAEMRVHRALEAMARPFDVTLLGMGADGHVASLYPFAGGLAKALDADDPALARAIRPKNLAAMGARLSLSLKAILHSRMIVLLLRGAHKLGALREAQAGDDAMAMPVRAVLRQKTTPVQIFWAP